MLVLKRLPGIVFTHKYKCISAIGILVLFVSSLYSWGIICSDFEAWDRLTSLCAEFRKDQISGDLCPKLCGIDSVVSISCQAFHAGKETVFSATLKNGQMVVVKSSQNFEQPEIFYWVDDFGEHYPTEDLFKGMVENRVKTRLNMTLTNDELEKLLHYPTTDKLPKNTPARQREMREIWRLLQDNEYLMSIVYAGRDIFSRVVGTCGKYFGVEYLKPAIDGPISKETKKNWADRVHLAVLILDLLEEIDSENLAICDVKPNHFGITNSGKLKILDLDVTFPKAIADGITKSGKSCEFDADCHLFDCRSVCNSKNKICDSPVINTNLQIICEKILLGWAMPGVVMVPGLLMSASTPSSLASLLRQCAHGAGSPEFDAQIATRLTHTLYELDAHLQEFD